MKCRKCGHEYEQKLRTRSDPDKCPKCSNKLWGHGFLLFNDLYLKRYRCNSCSSVITMKPSQFWKKYQSTISSIYHQLKCRLEKHHWPISTKRQRANQWLDKFITFIRMLYGLDNCGMTLVERLDSLYYKRIPFFS